MGLLLMELMVLVSVLVSVLVVKIGNQHTLLFSFPFSRSRRMGSAHVILPSMVFLSVLLAGFFRVHV